MQFCCSGKVISKLLRDLNFPLICLGNNEWRHKSLWLEGSLHPHLLSLWQKGLLYDKLPLVSDNYNDYYDPAQNRNTNWVNLVVWSPNFCARKLKVENSRKDFIKASYEPLLQTLLFIHIYEISGEISVGKNKICWQEWTELHAGGHGSTFKLYLLALFTQAQ